MASGLLRMSLALTFAALRAAKPAAKAIVWTRMDQKSCLKAIVSAGFTPIVVENLIEVGCMFYSFERGERDGTTICVVLRSVEFSPLPYYAALKHTGARFCDTEPLFTFVG